MNLQAIEGCAQILYQSRTKRNLIPSIPSQYRPKDLKEAYDCQKRLAELMGGKKIGWKAANINKTSQTFLDLYELLYGPLLSSPFIGVIGTPSKPLTLSPISTFNLRLCEPEFALLLGDNLEPVAVAPAIEIVHTCFQDWKIVGAPSLIADLACNGGWIRGEAIPIEKVQLDTTCKLIVNGKLFAEGSSDRILGSPLKVWELILQQRDYLKIEPGDWLSTGVCVDPPYHYCNEGDVIEAQFSGGIGTVAFKCENF